MKIRKTKVVRSPRCTGMPKEGECQKGVRRTGFSFAADYRGTAKEKLRPDFGRNRKPEKKHRTRRTPFVSRLLLGWNCPTPNPCRCSSARRKVCYGFSQATMVWVIDSLPVVTGRCGKECRQETDSFCENAFFHFFCHPRSPKQQFLRSL